MEWSIMSFIWFREFMIRMVIVRRRILWCIRVLKVSRSFLNRGVELKIF